MKIPTSTPTVIEREGHAVIHGDALTALELLIPDKSVDLIFADPPYNIGKNFNGLKDRWPSDEAYMAWCMRWMHLCLAKLKDNGSFYLMTSTQKLADSQFFNELLAEITLGNTLSFQFETTANKADFGSVPDAFSVFMLDPNTLFCRYSRRMPQQGQMRSFSSVLMEARRASILHPVARSEWRSRLLFSKSRSRAP